MFPERGRVLWNGISLEEAVPSWKQMPNGDKPLITIFGRETFIGEEIAELRSDPIFQAASEPVPSLATKL